MNSEFYKQLFLIMSLKLSSLKCKISFLQISAGLVTLILIIPLLSIAGICIEFYTPPFVSKSISGRIDPQKRIDEFNSLIAGQCRPEKIQDFHFLKHLQKLILRRFGQGKWLP